ncbi:MAG: hypothetical protein ABI175_19015 [Polyangiales bacterium]
MQLGRIFATASLFVLVESALTSLTGCPADPTPPVLTPTCTLPFLGDKSKPVQIEIVARDVAGRSSPVTEGSDVAIVFPPQGGRVIFVGARATNLDPCGVKLTGVLRDPATAQVRLDVRTVNLVVDGTGLGGAVDSDISTFANVPLCPNQWASDDVNDKPYEVEITLTDKTGRSGTKKVKVVPRCNEPDRAVECRCICRKGYVLGEACAASDGGVDASSTDASTDADEDGG